MESITLGFAEWSKSAAREDFSSTSSITDLVHFFPSATMTSMSKHHFNFIDCFQNVFHYPDLKHPNRSGERRIF